MFDSVSEVYQTQPSYVLVSGSAESVAEEVNGLIAQAYIPNGAPFIHNGVFYQAMIKRHVAAH